MSVDGAKKPLVLAVPSKGRLQENAAAFFARAGLDIAQSRGARDYRGNLAGMENVEIAFLSATDIVAQLAAGHVHLGVTGEDLVRETIADAEAKVELLAPLGFGHAHVVVAVPRAWIDVKTMADLEDVAAAFRARRGDLDRPPEPCRGSAMIARGQPLVLAVPSKGRLQENAAAFFARAGLQLVHGSRDYRGTLAGLDNV